MPETPDDLKNHNCLRWGPDQRLLNDWPFDGGQVETVRGNIELNNGETLYRLALAGVGLMRIAEFVAEPAIRNGRLIPVLTDYTRNDRLPIFALYQHRRNVPRRVRAFLEFLLEKFSPDPPWRRTPPTA